VLAEDPVYESPPWRPEPWLADRPADLVGGQPEGPLLGHPGPDQGYSLKLARRFEGRLVLTPGEHEDDAIAGCVAVANKRASLFGRAPMIHDLTVAFTLWGFLSEADPALVAARKPRFAAAALAAHYLERRRIADAVPAEVLRRPHTELLRAAQGDPTRAKLLDLADDAHGSAAPQATAG
jgi:hypothetical protein